MFACVNIYVEVRSECCFSKKETIQSVLEHKHPYTRNCLRIWAQTTTYERSIEMKYCLHFMTVVPKAVNACTVKVTSITSLQNL